MLKRFDYFVKESGEEDIITQFFTMLTDFNFVLVGGWAVGLYVNERMVTVNDLDILINPEDYNSLAEVAESIGFSVGGVGGAGLLTSKIKKNDFSFDVLIADSVWEMDALDYYRLLNWEGISIYVVYPEYLVVMKLYSGREKDFNDIKLLLKSGHVNLKFLDKLILKYFDRSIYDDFMRVLDIINLG